MPNSCSIISLVVYVYLLNMTKIDKNKHSLKVVGKASKVKIDICLCTSVSSHSSLWSCDWLNTLSVCSCDTCIIMMGGVVLVKRCIMKLCLQG